jgi:hypothetical protein
MALDRDKTLPTVDGRTSFYERPSLTLPDPEISAAGMP